MKTSRSRTIARFANQKELTEFVEAFIVDKKIFYRIVSPIMVLNLWENAAGENGYGLF